MDYIHVLAISDHGFLTLAADADLWMYLALTLPLTAMTVGGWLFWEWYTMRKVKKDGYAVV